MANQNKEKITEEFCQLINEETILLYDINSEVNTIPILIKNSLYKINSDKITTIILLKKLLNCGL